MPREVCVRNARVVEPGRLQEYSVFLIPALVAHVETVHIKASLDRSRMWATESLESRIVPLSRNEICTLNHPEELPFRKDRSTTWNVFDGFEAYASNWRCKPSEEGNLRVNWGNSESMQCRPQLLEVIESV